MNDGTKTGLVVAGLLAGALVIKRRLTPTFVVKVTDRRGKQVGWELRDRKPPRKRKARR